jgi:Cu/Ag efflux protein CusF
MQFASAVLFSLLAGLSSPALACNDHAPRTEPAPKPVARAASLSAGEVRELDLEEGTITLAHSRIAGLGMEPMSSMVFKASDPKLLTGLKPGDRVNFARPWSVSNRRSRRSASRRSNDEPRVAKLRDPLPMPCIACGKRPMR